MRLPAVVLLAAALMLISGCTADGGNQNQTGNQTPGPTPVPVQPVILSDGVKLVDGQCSSRGIEGSVVVFYSTGCPACAQAVPVLEEISAENPEREFRFLNLVSDRDEIDGLGLIPTHIPTVIISCSVYVGARTKEQYLSYMEGE
jgi:thiol-disulfide isomerase/thioredoxin